MSQMKIKLMVTEVGQGTTKAGKPYEFLEVTYKNLSFDNKTETKKVMPFGAKEVFNTLRNADPGQVFTLLREKDNAGYWQWIGITEGDTVIETTAPSGGGAKPATSAGASQSPRSTYETPEERAKKQVYIVRQSSISAAIETLKTDKKVPTVNEVLAVAKQYEAYVFGLAEAAAVAAEPLPTFDEDEDIPM